MPWLEGRVLDIARRASGERNESENAGDMPLNPENDRTDRSSQTL